MKRPDMLLSISPRPSSMIESFGSIGILDTRREGRWEEGLVDSSGGRILGPRMMRRGQGKGTRTKGGKEETGSIGERGRREAIVEEVIGTEEIEATGIETAGREEIVEIEVTEAIGSEATEVTETATEMIGGIATTEESETTAPDETTKTERSEPIEARNPNANLPQSRRREKKNIDLCFC